MWAELRDARNHADEISKKLQRLLKEQSSLMKNEIAKHSDKLIADIDDSLVEIEKEYKSIIENIEKHKKVLKAKSKFLRRHNNRIFKDKR